MPSQPKSKVTKKNTRPYLFPAGTKVTFIELDFDVSSFDRARGATTMTATEIGAAVSAAINAYVADHGSKPPAEDMFVTVAFTSFSILVEVSDRLRPNREFRAVGVVADGLD